jgi:hypothetical protein
MNDTVVFDYGEYGLYPLPGVVSIKSDGEMLVVWLGTYAYVTFLLSRLRGFWLA